MDSNTPQSPSPDTSDAPAPPTAEAVPGSTGAPQAEVDPETPAFGWTRYAERINGRFAMIGFVALLILEWITRQDFFTWLGF